MTNTPQMFTNPVQTWTRFFFKTSELIWSANKALFSQAMRVGTGLVPTKLRPILGAAPLSATAPSAEAEVKSVLLHKSPLQKTPAARRKTAVKAPKSHTRIARKTRSVRDRAH